MLSITLIKASKEASWALNNKPGCIEQPQRNYYTAPSHSSFGGQTGVTSDSILSECDTLSWGGGDKNIEMNNKTR